MKGLPSENYHIIPFAVHKAQSYQYTFLDGTNPDQVSISLAVNRSIIPVVNTDSGSWYFSPNWFGPSYFGPAYFGSSGSAVDAIPVLVNPANDTLNPNGTHKMALYNSVLQLFYGGASLWNGGQSLRESWYPTGSQLYVISMAQQSYGNGIIPSSFTLTVGSSTASLQDDGAGNLSAGGGVIGHIFYGLGVAVVQQDTSPLAGAGLSGLGMYLTTGSVTSVNFRASHTIYQHTVMCTMDIGDFNYSSNPSVASTQSVAGDNVSVMDSFASGSLTPYMTTVGLYSDEGELVAVGKFPRPIKRAIDSQQTVLIKFDL